MICIGLNPSNADETKDDPTIRRLKTIANTQGFGGLIMLNLFAFITPYPEQLMLCPDPVGENDQWIQKTINENGLSAMVVFAWGSFKEAKERAKVVLKMMQDSWSWCFEKNKDGSPKHPLYLPSDIKPIKFQ
jgi:hypothetical protein